MPLKYTFCMNRKGQMTVALPVSACMVTDQEAGINPAFIPGMISVRVKRSEFIPPKKTKSDERHTVSYDDPTDIELFDALHKKDMNLMLQSGGRWGPSVPIALYLPTELSQEEMQASGFIVGRSVEIDNDGGYSLAKLHALEEYCNTKLSDLDALASVFLKSGGTLSQFLNVISNELSDSNSQQARPDDIARRPSCGT